jgi:Na+/melibiose symporter-like transporter
MTDSPLIAVLAAPRPARPSAPQHPTARIKATAGAGQMVESVSTAVFATFLFFYYTALLGLPGSLVGAATAISLAIDAVADPLLASQLTPTMLTHLVWSAGPTAAAVSAVATGVLSFYRIDRRRHALIAETLRSRRRAGV